jgi:hypothetical protein
MIPATLMGFVSLVSFISGAVLFWIWLEAETSGYPVQRSVVPVFAGTAAYGTLCLAGAVAWGKGRWGWAMVATGIAVGVYVVIGVLVG